MIELILGIVVGIKITILTLILSKEYIRRKNHNNEIRDDDK